MCCVAFAVKSENGILASFNHASRLSGVALTHRSATTLATQVSCVARSDCPTGLHTVPPMLIALRLLGVQRRVLESHVAMLGLWELFGG